MYAVLQTSLFDAAEEEAHVIGGVQQDGAPHALIAFQHIDTGVVLLNLPKMLHAKAEQIANDGLIHGIVGCDQNSFVWIFFDIFR